MKHRETFFEWVCSSLKHRYESMCFEITHGGYGSHSSNSTEDLDDEQEGLDIDDNEEDEVNSVGFRLDGLDYSEMEDDSSWRGRDIRANYYFDVDD